MGKVTVESLGYKPKPIDPDFMSKKDVYPETGEHFNHKVFAEGVERLDEDGKPYPTKLGIHGTMVAVDFEACIADGACMDACPVQVFEWFLNPGKMGTGQDLDLTDKPDLKAKYACDKSDPVRESDCIFCLACETVCPTHAIKITQM
jgi:NAD-dependent dihydropyrimidine dehydrogenase PreA subunit